MQDQSILSISMYPWTFKILIAIFFDAFFSKKIGKCKTYILLCGILKIILTTIFAFFIDDMVADLEIYNIAIYYFILNTVAALESIAVDAWLLTLMDEKD